MAVHLNTLEDLFFDTLKDLYSAENQLVSALPRMASAASSLDLKRGLEEHLEETKQQIKRLEQIFAEHGESPRGRKCLGMEGLIREGDDLISETRITPEVLDAGLLAAAQKMEHYEMATYGTARTYAEMLGHDNVAQILDLTLDEEKSTNRKLTALAEGHINQDAKLQSQ